MEIFIGILVGLLYTVSTVVAYIIGIKHGRIIKNDGLPNISPIKIIDNSNKEKKQKKELDLFSEGLSNILNYGEVISDVKQKNNQ